jgi:hypothetical protein
VENVWPAPSASGFLHWPKQSAETYLAPMTKTTDWRDYTLRMLDQLARFGARHYIKKDLQEFLPEGYPNLLRVPQHHRSRIATAASALGFRFTILQCLARPRRALAHLIASIAKTKATLLFLDGETTVKLEMDKTLRLWGPIVRARTKAQKPQPHESGADRRNPAPVSMRDAVLKR